MLKRVNHIAIAVPDLTAAAETYRRLGVEVSPPQELPEHGVKICFLVFDNVKLELLEPLGENSPISSFLAKHPAGGMHHICFDVEALPEVSAVLQGAGVRLLGGGHPRS